MKLKKIIYITFSYLIYLYNVFRKISIKETESLSFRWIVKASEVNNFQGISKGFNILKFSNNKHWQDSYPEVTGYIISTLIKLSKINKTIDKKFVKNLVDWLISIQNTDGSYKGGVVSSKDIACIFDTGQIIRGLFDFYLIDNNNSNILDVVMKASNWMLSMEFKKQGFFLEGNSMSLKSGPRSFNIYAVDTLVRVGQLTKDSRFTNLGNRVADYTISQIENNYWVKNCELNKNFPNTHTLGYTIEGLYNLGVNLQNKKYIDISFKILKKLFERIHKNGYLNSTFDSNWNEIDGYSCLTGSAQIGNMLINLYRHSGERIYLDRSIKVFKYIQNRQNSVFEDFFGGKGSITGSWPINGNYCAYQSISWANKFLLDFCINLHDVENSR